MRRAPIIFDLHVVMALFLLLHCFEYTGGVVLRSDELYDTGIVFLAQRLLCSMTYEQQRSARAPDSVKAKPQRILKTIHAVRLFS